MKIAIVAVIAAALLQGAAASGASRAACRDDFVDDYCASVDAGAYTGAEQKACKSLSFPLCLWLDKFVDDGQEDDAPEADAEAEAEGSLCSESIQAISKCYLDKCPDKNCDQFDDADTCNDVQSMCDEAAACCGGCGPELAGLLDKCTPGDGAGPCNIQTCNAPEDDTPEDEDAGGNSTRTLQEAGAEPSDECMDECKAMYCENLIMPVKTVCFSMCMPACWYKELP